MSGGAVIAVTASRRTLTITDPPGSPPALPANYHELGALIA